MSLSLSKPNTNSHYTIKYPKTVLNTDELAKLGYKIDKSGNRYNINGVLEVDIRSLKFFDLIKRTEGYIFSKKELSNPNGLNITRFIRNFFQNQ